MTKIKINHKRKMSMVKLPHKYNNGSIVMKKLQQFTIRKNGGSYKNING